MIPSYDEVKEGISNGSYRNKLKQLFPNQMTQLEQWEKQDGYC